MATPVTHSPPLLSGRLEIELTSLLSSDPIAVDGQVALGGQLNVKLLGGSVPAGGEREIIAATEGIMGSFTRISSCFSTRIDGNRLFLTAIPERVTWQSLAFTATFGFRRRRLG